MSKYKKIYIIIACVFFLFLAFMANYPLKVVKAIIINNVDYIVGIIPAICFLSFVYLITFPIVYFFKNSE
jgi:hypothetical protein